MKKMILLATVAFGFALSPAYAAMDGYRVNVAQTDGYRMNLADVDGYRLNVAETDGYRLNVASVDQTHGLLA